MNNQSLTPNPEEQPEQKTPPFSDSISDASSDDAMMKTSINEPTPSQMASPNPIKTMPDTPSASSAASQPTPPASKPPSAPYDPHATQFVANDQPPVNVDPYATEFIQIPAEEKAAAIETAKRKTQDRPAVPASEGRNMPSFNVPKMNISGTSIVSGLGLLPMSAIYVVMMLLSALGLAWFMRFFGILLLYGEISIVRTILGVLGAGLAGGLFFALKYLPQLGGLQERFDTLDQQRQPIAQPITDTRAQLDFWFFLFAGLVISVSIVAGSLATEQVPIIHYSGDDGRIDDIKVAQAEFYDENAYREIPPLSGKLEATGDDQAALGIEVVNPVVISSIFISVIGMLILVGVSVYSPVPAIVDLSTKRDFKPAQMIVPLAAGAGLILLAWGLKLISHQIDDFIYFFLFALVGMYALGGFSLQVLPARFLHWVSQLRLGFFVAIITVTMMSLVTLFLDSSTVDNGFDYSRPLDEGFSFTWRFAYSPAYFAYTIGDRNVLLAVVLSILLVAFGLLGIFLTLQAFGYELVEQQNKGKSILGFVVTWIALLLPPYLVLFLALRVLSISYILEGILLLIGAFAILMALLWVIRTRTTVVDGVLERAQNLFQKFSNPGLLFLIEPLRKITAVRSEDIKALITWPLGIALAMGLSIVAAPFALSFWFYLLVLILVLFLTSDQQLRRPTATVPPPTASEASVSSLPPTPSVAQPTQQIHPPMPPEDGQK